jgi:putative oxidoreductase
MKATGYLQNLVYATEFLTGIAILTGILMPLALIALAPIIVNIALFHFFLDFRPERIVLILLIIGAYSILIYHYHAAFEPLFDLIKPTWSFRIFQSFSVRFVIQIIMSLVFIVAGSAKLIIPEQLNLGNFLIDGMKATGYLYTLLGITEVIAGLALWHRRLIPIALVILTPIAINIFAYHFFLAVAGLPIAILLLLAHISLVIAYFPAYRTLLKMS